MSDEKPPPQNEVKDWDRVEAPGRKSWVLRKVLETTGLAQLARDVRGMYRKAQTDEERERIEAFFRSEAKWMPAKTIAWKLGAMVAIHALIMIEPWSIVFLAPVLIGAIWIWLVKMLS